MGHGHYCGLGNLGVLVQHIFNFPGGNILAAADNDVFLAVSDNNGTLGL